MASLYQRFGGKINTSRSFPVTPEASHLLGPQCAEEDSSAAAANAAGGEGKASRPLQQDNPRPRFQYQARRSDCEEEDVSHSKEVLKCKLEQTRFPSSSSLSPPTLRPAIPSFLLMGAEISKSLYLHIALVTSDSSRVLAWLLGVDDGANGEGGGKVKILLD
uniref:Uncharacterized protein n=1 Tax=Podarcis muralis TaxID=64176 RepID=A0A670J6R0_PODMU